MGREGEVAEGAARGRRLLPSLGQDHMNGYYEVCAQGPKREQFRLFCILENAEKSELERRGLPGPAIAVITGLRKP